MIETNPFGVFVPKKAQYLLLGSFGGKMGLDNNYDWFYGTKRNHFWPIMRSVYNLKLETTKEKQKLFSRLKLAITDIIYQCERKRGSNLDNNLINIVYNVDSIEKVLKENRIKKIFFTSRFVETHFRRMFKQLIQKYVTLELVTLPSPSPRYAKLSMGGKIKKYKELLPKPL